VNEQSFNFQANGERIICRKETARSPQGLISFFETATLHHYDMAINIASLRLPRRQADSQDYLFNDDFKK